MSILIPPRLIDEICHVGKLNDYRIPLTNLLTRMYADGLKVSTSYDVGYSSILNGHVRVTLIGVIHPLDIIWELLHEYGHFLSGERKPEAADLEREEKAWFFADNLIVSFPGLVLHYEKYNVCKQRCLKSYQLKKSRK